MNKSNAQETIEAGESVEGKNMMFQNLFITPIISNRFNYFTKNGTKEEMLF